MIPEWIEVWSDAVQAVAYDAASAEFSVRWANGKVSVYSGVPPDRAEEIARSPSVGAAVWELRRGGHGHRYGE